MMIKDNNLKLMLIDCSASLREKHCIGWNSEYEEFCLASFGAEIEFDWDSYEINTKAESFLLGLELPKEDLLAIESLTLDGDHSIFCLLTEDFHHQIEHFYVKSIGGIENCENLTYLNLGTLAEYVDLSPLTHLKNLEKLTLSSYNATNYNALLSVKSLKTLHIFNWSTYSEDERAAFIPVLKQLKARGCEVMFSPATKGDLL